MNNMTNTTTVTAAARTLVVTSIEVDEDRFATARLECVNPAHGGGGYITDHPYWVDKDGHYVPGVSDLHIGDFITL